MKTRNSSGNESWFLLDVQSHKASTDTKLVEGGQLLALWVHPHVGLGGPKDQDSRHNDNNGRR